MFMMPPPPEIFVLRESHIRKQYKLFLKEAQFGSKRDRVYSVEIHVFDPFEHNLSDWDDVEPEAILIYGPIPGNLAWAVDIYHKAATHLTFRKGQYFTMVMEQTSANWMELGSFLSFLSEGPGVPVPRPDNLGAECQEQGGPPEGGGIQVIQIPPPSMGR